MINGDVFKAVTCAVMNYIFTSNSQKSKEALLIIRKTICESSFMTESGYIKGLLVKGLRLMLKENGRKRPVVGCLKNSEMLEAFS